MCIRAQIFLVLTETFNISRSRGQFSSLCFSGHIPRAVILFGPMVDVLYEKLCEEVPYKFVQCKPGMQLSIQQLLSPSIVII